MLLHKLLLKTSPFLIEYIETNDTFGESGTPLQLLKKYGLDTPNIVEAAQKLSQEKDNLILR